MRDALRYRTAMLAKAHVLAYLNQRHRFHIFNYKIASVCGMLVADTEV